MGLLMGRLRVTVHSRFRVPILSAREQNVDSTEFLCAASDFRHVQGSFKGIFPADDNPAGPDVRGPGF